MLGSIFRLIKKQLFGEDEPYYPRRKRYKKRKYKRSKTYINEDGYRIYKDSGRFVHHVNAEKRIGRRLRKGEVVHHIDRDKLNNRPSNLWVFKNQEEHNRAHEDDEEEHGIFSYISYKRKNRN